MSFNISVPSIGCASCIETITRAIQSVDNSAKIIGDLEKKSLWIDSTLDEVKLRELITSSGHEAV
jgi:copper chaperone